MSTPAAMPAVHTSADAVARLTASRVVVVAGKGGVGKTTVTAVLARAAADAGRRVLAVELDGKPALAPALAHLVGAGAGDGISDGPGEVATDAVGDRVSDGVEVRAISATDALDEYLRDHGFARIAKRLATSGVIDVVATAAPGIDDIVVLGKIKQLERSGEWDLIVVDGPAAGHAVTFLMSPAGMLDAVRGGPVRAQAVEVLEMLRDAERCQVVLVTVPEATPVNEVVETAFALEDRVGVQLGPVVVNAVDVADDVPDPRRLTADDPRFAGVDASDVAAVREGARFRRARRASAREQIERLRAELPLPQVHLPARPVAGMTRADIAELVAALRTGTAVGSS
jgi:arsenite-transporting ATPase